MPNPENSLHATVASRGVAIIGAGSIVARHIRAIQATAGLEMRWVVSRSPARAEAMVAAEAPGARATTITDTAINDPHTDLIVVAYPTADHHRLVCAAFAAGKDVVCEKPLCATVDEAADLLAALTAPPEHGARPPRLTVGHIRRYWPPMEYLRALFGPAAPLGQPTQATWTFWSNWSWPPSWRTEQEGGYLLDVHVHEMDLLLWLLDAQPRTVYAVGRNAADSAGVVTVDCAPLDGGTDRRIARLEWCGHVPGHDYPARATHRAEVIGQHGWARFTSDGPTLAVTWATRDGEPQQRTWTFPDTIAAAWRDMWADFAHYTATGAPPRIDAPAAARALAALLAAHHAMQSGRGEIIT